MALQQDTELHRPLLVDGLPIPFEDLKTILQSLPPQDLLHRLRLDQENRWRLGKPVFVEDYFRMFPSLSQDSDSRLVLIFGEVMARRHFGEDPALADYQHRFPDLSERLAMLFALEQQTLGNSNPTGMMPSAQISKDEKSPTAKLEIPDYKILGTLGSGGMGIVYKAQQLSLNRPVAIKMVLEGNLARPNQVENIRREAELAARLQHPNIVQIFEVGTYKGCPFISMEFVDGGSLAQKIGGQPEKDPREAASTVETLALAMHAAHCKEIIHRDLKPANVLFKTSSNCEEGADRKTILKIVDFGLSRVVNEDSQISTTTASMGTPCYMAPEQADGRAKDIGPCTDIYALGAILYELLTGRPPFLGASAWDTLGKIRTDHPEPPSRSEPATPRDLETICLKCLEKDPKRRYGSALELAQDLHRFRQGETILARPTSFVEKSWRWCRRNPGWASMIGSTALLLIIIAAAQYAYSRQLGEELANSQKLEKQVEGEQAKLEKELKKTKEQRDRAAMAEKKLLAEYWRGLIALADSKLAGKRPGQRFETLDLLKKALDAVPQLAQPFRLGDKNVIPENVIRDIMVTTTAVPDLFPYTSWPGFPKGSTAVDFDESLERYARMDVHGNCSLRQVADDRELFALAAPKDVDGTGLATFPILSRDGRLLALHFDNNRVQLYNVSGAKPELVLTADNVNRLDFDPRGHGLVLGHKDGALSWYDTATGHLKNKTKANKDLVDPLVALHPTLPLVAICSTRRPDAEVRDLRDGSRVGFLPSGPAPFPNLVWSPDGNYLVMANNKGIVFHDRADQYKPSRMFPTSLGPATLSFDIQSELLAGVGWNHEVHLIKAATGQTLLNLPPVSVPVAALRFNKDGTKLAAFANNGRLFLWKVAEGRGQRRFWHNTFGGQTLYYNCAVSPKMPRLVAAAMEEGLGFWDLTTGRQLAFLDLQDMPRQQTILQVLFEPGGDLLTCGRGGTQRWPVSFVDKHLHVGPPLALRRLPGGNDLSINRDGTLIAASYWTDRANDKSLEQSGGVRVFSPSKESVQILDKGENVKNVTLSPDGRWLACGLQGRNMLKIWDVQTLTLVKQLTAMGNVARFSPDGHWLAVSGEKGGLFEVGTWRAGPTFEGLAAFSNDGKILAVESGEGRIHLVDPITGNEWGVLEDPNQAVAEKILFTPDDRGIITINNATKPGMRVWDLPLVRAQLKLVGLDWNMPPLGSVMNLDETPFPPVEIEYGK